MPSKIEGRYEVDTTLVTNVEIIFKLNNYFIANDEGYRITQPMLFKNLNLGILKETGFSGKPKDFIGVLYVGNKDQWLLKVYGEENYRPLSELAGKISDRFKIPVSIEVRDKKPRTEAVTK